MNSGESTDMSQCTTFSNTVVIITGGVTLALALMVVTGWHTHNILLIQVSPAFAPMQYNTAMGFLLCGAGLLAIAFDRRRLVMACGVLVVVIGLLT
ncbi:MAG: hypothetical protein IIB73_06880, partial [Proteobacteria bacterium]|nr:hypothetical protein [Pseudomonadota bacterium]